MTSTRTPTGTSARRSTRTAAVTTLRVVAAVVGVAVSAGFAVAVLTRTFSGLGGNRMAPWIIGRAAGITAYVLLLILVLTGMLLSHPWRSRIARPSNATRIRLHIALALFTAGFTALHVVVLATDRYAGVGWPGALLPMGASYRPVATTLGLIALWLGLLVGITAALAGRLPLRAWWPIHKLAAIAWVLVWLHGVFGGGDSAALLWLYLTSAGIVLVVGVGRYSARTPQDLRAELAR
jgi:hypothetical protein